MMANIGRSWVQSTRNGRLIGSGPVLVRKSRCNERGEGVLKVRTAWPGKPRSL